ncbi:MAG: hypothetical protein IPI25_00980 [Candidatus Brocadia sp.]|nr:MAG: hypothetical protein IPI25_00980 [Candidatus Brocadia sp.]
MKWQSLLPGVVLKLGLRIVDNAGLMILVISITTIFQPTLLPVAKSCRKRLFPSNTYFPSPSSISSDISVSVDSVFDGTGTDCLVNSDVLSVSIEDSLGGNEATEVNIKNSTLLFSFFPAVVLLDAIGRFGPKPAT